MVLLKAVPVEFGPAETVMDPAPVPPELETLNQPAPGETLQAHEGPLVLTLTVTEPPSCGKPMVPGVVLAVETVYVQADAALVSVNAVDAAPTAATTLYPPAMLLAEKTAEVATPLVFVRTVSTSPAPAK